MTMTNQSDAERLLACPFCGGKAYQDKVEHRSLFWVACQDCGIDGKIKNSADEAITAWNTRAAPDAPQPASQAVQPAEPLSDETYRLARVAINEAPKHLVQDWQTAAMKVCKAVAAIKSKDAQT